MKKQREICDYQSNPLARVTREVLALGRREVGLPTRQRILTKIRPSMPM